MKTGALLTILVSELLILMMMSVDIQSSSLSFVSTLVVVVIVAFSFSAILQNIKSLTTSKKYGISGLMGIAAGLLYFWWASDHFNAIVQWLKTYGVYFLFLIIFICALFLYTYKGDKKRKNIEESSQF
ncbi:hypothetical protein [Wenyingzhuangia marina]|uniref:Uncharacterized protein n=1 Tax=Wenyingzhuangia marina TaxID=1195760 RepID=A0A1M5V8T3_9FLAO|nr:hypothetical protein [Wenyingzhuangia marina]GGF73658.1 hypothetical protein GCM10011397_15730 [Wenyingzhuangia marina]SHH71611.1 hypothetical protein SAMN05444281_1606 [Wenyingzhuangia marina]